MSPLKASLAAIGLMAVTGLALPAYAQTDPSKTGTGPRGTAVGPSTEPSPNSNGTGGTAAGAKSGKTTASDKSSQPAQGTGR
jgi:hypothetical protein